MTETTQTTRYLVRADVDRHEPCASVMFSAKVIRGLLNDADRLSQAEALLREARVYTEPHKRKLTDRIDAFLSDGGE